MTKQNSFRSNRALTYIVASLAVAGAIASASFLAGCQTSPTGRQQLILLPDDQMDSMGAQSFQELKSQQQVERDPAMNAYVKCVANAITSTMGGGNWEVVVFKEDSANAFALPGGKIGVHTGMLKVAQTPDQLAAVIGHEVGHVLAKHGNERMSETLGAQTALALFGASQKNRDESNWKLALASLGVQFGYLLPHSRNQESEADVIGLELMSKAGFDPRQSVELWKNMSAAGGGQPPEFMSTHPSHETRINDLTAAVPNAMAIYNATKNRPNCKR